MYYPKEILNDICIFIKFYLFLVNQPEPQLNPNHEKIQNILSILTPFMASGIFFTDNKGGSPGNYFIFIMFILRSERR